MKRLAITALALSLLAGTAATAAPQRHDDYRDNGRYEQSRYDDRRDDRADRRDDRRDYRDERKDDRRDYRADRRDDRREYRRWARGQRLDARYRGNSYYVSDYHRHGLRAPPRGYRWQRVNDQYVMSSVATGLIASVIIASR
ncbi:RcnB family protein [Caulobacter sp. DWR1-3-2b1]|uniref:RcnB family protein n=1 Tax=Caulobacter sp. DWR1-3-2b1 TaxID=2804670 RepID=UPI003CF32C59